MVVAWSSVNAENRAMVLATRDLVWIKQLLGKFLYKSIWCNLWVIIKLSFILYQIQYSIKRTNIIKKIECVFCYLLLHFDLYLHISLSFFFCNPSLNNYLCEQRVYRKQPLYPIKVGVRYTYILTFPDPICGITPYVVQDIAKLCNSLLVPFIVPSLYWFMVFTLSLAIRPSPSWKLANQKWTLFPFYFFWNSPLACLIYYGSTMFMVRIMHWLKLLPHSSRLLN